MVIKFSELDDSELLKNEIISTYGLKCGINENYIKSKNWIYAVLDSKQLLEDDAVNLAYALEEEGVNCVLGAWVVDLLNRDDFEVEKIIADSKSIENIQNPECRIDHMDSFLFSEYPLQFLIIRPDTFQNMLYLIGSIDFVKNSAKSEGWEIFIV